ncbi:MAG: globin domain-containing protein [Gemmatimonadales bacterium]
MIGTAPRIAQESYSRCLRSPRFFPTLYEHLLASDPAIPPMFAETEFPKQHKLLQHGLGLLLSYANRMDDTLLDRIAARHSSSGIGVPPAMYALFVDSLLATVRELDPRCAPEIEAAWREALAPGIAYMKARY